MTGRGALRVLGRAVDRVTDNWFVDFVTGNWFDRPIDNYLDHSNTQKPPPRPRYLDADGNEIAPPPPAATDLFGPTP